MTELELVSTEDLIQELRNRHEIAVVLLAKKLSSRPGAKLPDDDVNVWAHTEGPFFAFLGLAEAFVTQKKMSLQWAEEEE